jgi:hypothetical protein
LPRKDAYHDTVRAALIKDGWQITDDPFLIDFRGTLLFADLGAERASGLRRRKISIEVKVLNEPARFAKFECAVGQYVVYRRLIASLDWNVTFIWRSHIRRSSISFRNDQP